MADSTAQPYLIDVPIPSMGATVNELTVIDVMVQTGDRFAKGDKIVELESDKSVFEFEAPCDGILRELKVRAGDIVPSGSPFMQIETSDISLKHLETKEDAAATPAPVPSVVESAPVVAEVADLGSLLYRSHLHQIFFDAQIIDNKILPRRGILAHVESE